MIRLFIIFILFCSSSIAGDYEILTTGTKEIKLLSEHSKYNGGKCYDIRGHRVHFFIGEEFGAQVLYDVAFATWGRIKGKLKPIIVFQNRYFQKLSTNANLLLYYHECGHHVLGHMYNSETQGLSNSKMEYAADCYAVTRFLEKRSKKDLKLALVSFSKSTEMSLETASTFFACRK